MKTQLNPKKAIKMDFVQLSVRICSLFKNSHQMIASVTKGSNGSYNVKIISDKFKGMSEAQRVVFAKDVLNQGDSTLLKHHSIEFNLLDTDDSSNIQNVSITKEYWSSYQEFLINV